MTSIRRTSRRGSRGRPRSGTRSPRICPTTTAAIATSWSGGRNVRDPRQLRRIGAPAHPEQGGPGNLVVADHEPRCSPKSAGRTSSRISSSTRGPNRSRRRSPTPASNVIYRATTSTMRAYTPVYGSRGSLSYVTGSHAIKGGYTLIMGDYEQTSTRVGNMSFTAINGVPNVGDLRRHADARDQPRPAESRHLRAGSVDGRSPDGERRAASRLLPQ